MAECFVDEFLMLERYTFNRPTIDRAPRFPGVYGIFDRSELVYIGCAGAGREATIREALAGHLAGSFGPCTTGASRYCWEIIEAPADRARTLRARFEAANGRALRCQETGER